MAEVKRDRRIDPTTGKVVDYGTSGGGQHDNANEKPPEKDEHHLTSEEVEGEGGLAALARKRRKPSAGSQGDALAGVTPTPTPRPRPRPRSDE